MKIKSECAARLRIRNAISYRVDQLKLDGELFTLLYGAVQHGYNAPRFPPSIFWGQFPNQSYAHFSFMLSTFKQCQFLPHRLMNMPQLIIGSSHIVDFKVGRHLQSRA